MATKILTEKDQAFGMLDEGRIRERKPVAFPSDQGGIWGYSSLYYWSYTWSEEGGTIEQESHKGFEVITYVIEGKLEHMDSVREKWIPLVQGDVQIIRGGSGLSHTERLGPGTRLFQIWFDPDLRLCLQKNPSYNDYEAEEFEYEESDGMRRTVIAGPGSPLTMAAPATIIRYDMEPGTYQIPLEKNHVTAAHLFEGQAKVGGGKLTPGMFVMSEKEKEWTVEVKKPISLMCITVPESVPYKTYIDQLQPSV